MGRPLFGARKQPIAADGERKEPAASVATRREESEERTNPDSPILKKAGSIRIHKLVEDTEVKDLPDDRDLADRILRACNELQEAMDTAVLAGLIVEPSFARIEGRLTRAGVKVDSFACSVKVFRKLA